MSQSACHCEFLPTMHKTSVCICEEGRQYKKVAKSNTSPKKTSPQKKQIAFTQIYMESRR